MHIATTYLLLSSLLFLQNVEKIEASELSRDSKRLSSLPFQFRIPRTGFTCKSRAPGYYADVGASCEVYHMCTERGGKQSFLCPPRTRFNQKTLVCDFRRNVKCTDSSEFFHKNIVLEEKSKEERIKNSRGNKGKLLNSRGVNTHKRPRLNRHFERFGLVEKKPQYIKTHGNGQMSFAPLFKERNRHNLARILDVPSTIKYKQPMQKNSFSLNELKEQETSPNLSKKHKQNSPIIHVTPAKAPKLRLLIAQEGGESLTKLRQDPEQPSQELLPPPPPSVNPFQIVGHVMSSKELVSFPDSPMVNISVTSDAQLGGDPIPSVGKGRASNEEPHFVGRNTLGLPLQLKKVSKNKNPPLIWVSPASLARSPMVSLRRLWDRDFPIRRTLTMSFPDQNRQEILRLTSSNNSL